MVYLLCCALNTRLDFAQSVRGYCAYVRCSRISYGVTLVGEMTVVMYVKPGCPYCQAAREHLAAEGATVEERDATQSSAWRAELMGYTNNRGMVPTIVSNDGSDVQVGFPPGRG